MKGMLPHPHPAQPPATTPMAAPTVHPTGQTYLARIRYMSEIPPLEGPPKMVDLAHEASPHLLEATLASLKLRTDSMALEVCSELGMPLDLLPTAGFFFGDQSGLAALDPIPPIHPSDRLLMRSISQLGTHSARVASGGPQSSFLRRNENLAAHSSHAAPIGKPRMSTSERNLEACRAQRAAAKAQDSDPVRILAAVLKGFDVANPRTKDKSVRFPNNDAVSRSAEVSWNNPIHPTKPNLRVVDTFPLLPDPAAQTDSQGYMVFQFPTGPLGPRKVRDTRVDVALLRPQDAPQVLGKRLGTPEQTFDLYIPSTHKDAKGMKQDFKLTAGEHTQSAEEFKYRYVRGYEIKNSKNYDIGSIPEAAMTIHLGGKGKEKGAYYYPVVGRYILHPKRTLTPFPLFAQPVGEALPVQQELPPDILNVRMRNLNREEKRRRRGRN